MKKWFAVLALLAVGGVLIYTLGFARNAAPQVAYTTLQGKPESLAALKGKVVLVNFWATSCSGCIEEMSQMKAMYQRYAAHGFAIVAVAMNYDTPSYVREYSSRNHLPFSVTFDGDGRIAKAFGDIQLTPSTFLLDREGNIVKRYVGVMNFAEIRQLIEGGLKS
ncbi:TlpA family protein disulfide reductase [Paludibacterium yongneupense]|uniref:TlpA family protein disulfide reductase n=1 Tax=Paludibacterium yongneupense TaxID=400061 RepID=UPI0004123DB9|nr:TlpA disulfide reductase family protein [Paludibacterium yongneupense]